MWTSPRQGTGEYNSRHLYTIKFRIGVTYKQLLEDIQREPFVRSVFTEMIFESHIAEIDGKLAMLLFIDGASDIDIVQTVQEKLIPSLENNHGKGSIEEVSTVRILSPVRDDAKLHPAREHGERLHPQRLAGRGDLRRPRDYFGRVGREERRSRKPESRKPRRRRAAAR